MIATAEFLLHLKIILEGNQQDRKPVIRNYLSTRSRFPTGCCGRTEDRWYMKGGGDSFGEVQGEALVNPFSKI